MDVMSRPSVAGGGGRCCISSSILLLLLLLQDVVIISAFPNLLTGDEINRLVDAGRMKSDDAKRVIEGQTTPEELALLKLELLKLNSSSSAPASKQQQKPPPHPALQKASLKFFESSGCDENPCRNGGVCTTPDVTSKDTTLCACPQGYYGEFCDFDSPDCETEPCLHNGECLRSNSNQRGYACLCPMGYIGDNCEVVVTIDTTTVEGPLVAAAPSASKSVLLSPVTIVILICLIFLILGMAFVATVEADRKVLTERYRVLISVGYRVDYPHIDFARLAAVRLRFLCCCCCYMLPCCTCGVYQEDDDDIPLPPNMRGGDPCAQLRSLVEATVAAANYSVPDEQSQRSLYEGGGGTVAQE